MSRSQAIAILLLCNFLNTMLFLPATEVFLRNNTDYYLPVSFSYLGKIIDRSKATLEKELHGSTTSIETKKDGLNSHIRQGRNLKGFSSVSLSSFILNNSTHFIFQLQYLPILNDSKFSHDFFIHLLHPFHTHLHRFKLF